MSIISWVFNWIHLGLIEFFIIFNVFFSKLKERILNLYADFINRRGWENGIKCTKIDKDIIHQN